MIRECGITKYKIWNRDDLLFSVMEYCGDDFKYDMAKWHKILKQIVGGKKQTHAKNVLMVH